MRPRLDLVGIVVGDIAKAVEFYRRVGLDFPDDTEGHGHVEATVGGMRVALDSEETIRGFDPDWAPGGGPGRIALAFLCDSPGDVDRLFRELVDAGAQPHKEPWDAFWGQRYAQIRDPDGNGVDLFAPLEGRE